MDKKIKSPIKGLSIYNNYFFQPSSTFLNPLNELKGGTKKQTKKIPIPKDNDSTNDWIEYINNIDDEEDFKNDCKDYEYIPSMLPPAVRLIVCGDFHGDFKLMWRSLRIAKTIDKKGNWIAKPKNTIIVQVGDQIDRCRPHIHRCENPKATHNDEASDIKILEFMTKLHKKAEKVGGKVISLLGNHEVMNSQGNLTYVSYKGLEEFKKYKDPRDPNLTFTSGKEARIHAFKPGNQYANFMACSRLSSVIIGSWLFVHAAILPALMAKFKMSKCDNIRKVNSLIRKWLLGQVNISNMRKLLNSDKISPFWPRILGNIPPNESEKNVDCKKYVDPVLKTLQVGHIIVGHTPQYYVHHHGINFTCGKKKVGRVDIGSSDAFHPFDIMAEDLANQNKKPEQKKDRGHSAESRIVQVLEILNDTECNIIEYKNGVTTTKKLD